MLCLLKLISKGQINIFLFLQSHENIQGVGSRQSAWNLNHLVDVGRGVNMEPESLG